MHILIKSVVWGGVIYLCYCGLLFVLQRQMIYPRYMVETPPGGQGAAAGLETIWLETDFGRVETWYLPPAANRRSHPHPAVIFAHGNAELIDHWPGELRAFAALGMGVLLVEYPGYGRSQGTPSQASITRTFVKAYDTLAARPDVDARRIILFGRSLGGGAVCALARERPSAALILMSAFTGTRAFAPRYLVPGFLIRDPFDNLSVVSAYAGPVLVIHGKRDGVIPHRHGAALAEAAKRGRLLTYECGHNDFPPGWFGFDGTIQRFLAGAGILAPDNRPPNVQNGLKAQSERYE